MRNHIFVSHASKDAIIVDKFVELLAVGCGVPQDKIFCTSLEGLGIPTGKDFIAFIRGKIQRPGLVLLMLSNNYMDSKFCLCELGATWGMGLKSFPLVIPPLKRNEISSVLAGTQMGIIDDAPSLDELRDVILKIYKKNIPTSTWSKKKEAFLKSLPPLLEQVTPVKIKKENVFFDGTRTLGLKDFKALPNRKWKPIPDHPKKGEFIGEPGHGDLETTENCILTLKRSDVVGRVDVFLLSYHTSEGEKDTIPNTSVVTNVRVFRVTCFARAISGSHNLLFHFRPRGNPDQGASKQYEIKEESWTAIDFIAESPNYPEYQLRMTDFITSAKPGTIQIRNLRVSEIFS